MYFLKFIYMCVHLYMCIKRLHLIHFNDSILLIWIITELKAFLLFLIATVCHLHNLK